MKTSEKTVKRVINEYKNKGEVTTSNKQEPNHKIISNLDDFIRVLIAIRRKVQFQFDKELPTIEKVTHAIKGDDMHERTCHRFLGRQNINEKTKFLITLAKVYTNGSTGFDDMA